MNPATDLNGNVGQEVSIVYHNPAIARPHRWSGERARQLVNSLGRAGGSVVAVPAVPSAPEGFDHEPRRGFSRFLARLPRRGAGVVVRIRLMQRGAANTVRWSWRLWRELRHDRPEVLLARYREFEWTPLVVARLLRCRLVLEVHSPFAIEEVLRGGHSSRITAWMDRKMFRTADLVWVHTPELEDLVRAVTPEASIRLAPFGIEDRGVVADPGGTDSSTEIVFVGSFYTWHGVEDLVDAFAVARRQVPELHLSLIGDGVARPEAEERVHRLGLSGAVDFPGWLDQKEMYERLGRSHIGVAPYRESKYNYFEPVKILDFQMAGLPIVATSVGHIPAMVADGASGFLVPAGDIQAMAAALVKLATDSDLRREMGAAARKSAHPVEETAAAVLEMCRSVV